MLIVTGVLAYLILFVSVRQLHPSGILFYQGIALTVLVPLVQGTFIYLRKRESPLTRFKDLAITFLLAYAFVVTIPTQAERSFSLRLLQHIGETPQGLTREEIGRLLYTVDFVEQGGLDKRLNEQRASGTVRTQAGKYVLTARGEATCAVTHLMCQAFACRGAGPRTEVANLPR